MRYHRPSPRAIEAARILMESGLTNREIGKRMNITERTAGRYIKQWFDFVEVNNRIELVRYLNCELFREGLAAHGINLETKEQPCTPIIM